MNNKKTLSEDEIEEKVKFLSSSRCNHTYHKYVDITGDLIEGTLLSRILYWFAPDKNNKSKVRIFKDGYFWIAKQRKDWWEEVRITKRQYDKAIGELNKKGFVELAKYKFNSMPTIHIRPNYENINKAVKEWEEELRKEIIEEYNDSVLHENENEINTKCNSLRNDGKCKTGITKDGSLLTGNTNSDYISDNTSINDNTEYVSSLKDGGKNIYAFSEEKGQKNTDEDDEEEYKTIKEKLRYEVFPRIDDYIEDNYEYEYENGMNLVLEDIITEFYDQYFMKYAKEHRIMRPETYEKIVDRYFMPHEDMEDVYDFESYKSMIECYFKTNYNKRGNYDGKIKLSIAHFFSENILRNLYHKIQC